MSLGPRGRPGTLTWQPTVFLCSLLEVRPLSGLTLSRVRPPAPCGWPVGLTAFSPSWNSSTSRGNWEQQPKTQFNTGQQWTLCEMDLYILYILL